jgi:uncharacterized protein YdeI (YjbR/CyaY-like superfamily)
VNAVYFRSAAEFRHWLATHAAIATELLVGFYKVGSGIPRMSWPESVDEALCYGWIDGVRCRVDDDRYTVRFTPRKAVSNWSAVNVARIAELRRLERLTPAGLAAFEARRENRSGIYSYEKRPDALPAPYQARLARKPKALRFFAAQPASYRAAAIWWVVSAKQEVTRLRRLDLLIENSRAGQRLKQFAPSRL